MVSSPGGYQEKHCYDDKGRSKFLRTIADGSNYDVGYTYDTDYGFLETITYPSSTGTPFRVVHEYETANRSGLLDAVRDYYSPWPRYWEATSVDAFGQYQGVTLGNGLETYRSFDSITGALRGIDTGPGGGSSVVPRAGIAQDSTSETAIKPPFRNWFSGIQRRQ